MPISLSVVKKTLLAQPADVYALFVTENFNARSLHAYEKLFPTLSTYLASVGFTGKRATYVAVPVVHQKSTRILCIGGLGQATNHIYDIESFRRSWGHIVRHAQRAKAASIAIQLPQATLFDATEEYTAQQAACIAHLAAYEFSTFKSKQDPESDCAIYLTVDSQSAAPFERGIKSGTELGIATNQAREWVNLPTNVLNTHELAEQAKKIAKDSGLQCTIYAADKIKAMGMGGLTAVGQGSSSAPCFVLLTYSARDKKAPTLALVGKGITFDTGGISLKPSEGLHVQKGDMAGAAAVIAAMGVIGKRKPNVNVVAAVAIAENSPSSTASRPGDIVKMYNGKTVEIISTDAEGRLILGDALAYMVKNYKPDFMIDLATLTGPCQRALGPFFSGLFTTDDELAHKVTHVAQAAGEPVWRLPLTIDYMDAMDAITADLVNSSKKKYFAGATTAAVFLNHFVGETPWVHVDIAGSALDVPENGYQRRELATGMGVRLLVELVETWPTSKKTRKN